MRAPHRLRHGEEGILVEHLGRLPRLALYESAIRLSAPLERRPDRPRVLLPAGGER